MSFASLIGEILGDDETRNSIINTVKEGVKSFSQAFDMDEDGDVDEDDARAILESAGMLFSAWGHAALADGELGEEEEETISELIDNLIFTEVITEDILDLLELSKKSAKKILFEKFENPAKLKKIAKYAEEIEAEELFYEHACIIVASDGKITEDEREFLDMFAKLLDLNKFDKRSIEKSSLKI